MVGTKSSSSRRTNSDTVLFFTTQELVEEEEEGGESFDYYDDDYDDDTDSNSGVPYYDDDDESNEDDDEETLTFQDGFVDYLDDLTVFTPENPDWVMALGKMVEQDKELQTMLTNWIQVQKDKNINHDNDNGPSLQHQDPTCSSPQSVVWPPPSSPSRQKNLEQIREALLTVAAANNNAKNNNRNNGHLASTEDSLYSGNSILEKENLVPNEERLTLRRIGSELYYVADDEEDDEDYTYDGDETTTIRTSTTTINNRTVNNIYPKNKTLKDKDGCGDPRLMYSLEALMGKVARLGSCTRVVCSNDEKVEKVPFPLQIHPDIAEEMGMEILNKEEIPIQQQQQQQHREVQKATVPVKVTEIGESQPLELPVEEIEQPESQPNNVDETPEVSSPNEIGQEVLLLEKSVSKQLEKHPQRQTSRRCVDKRKKNKKKGKEEHDDNTTSTKSSSRSGGNSGLPSSSSSSSSPSSRDGGKKMFRFLPKTRSSRRRVAI